MTAPVRGRPTGSSTAAAVVAAGVLALTSTGSIMVPAALLALASTFRSRSRAIALGGAVLAVGLRFATTSADDLAGLQSVLGSAGIIGPPAGAFSAWAAAAAILGTAVPLRPGSVPGGRRMAQIVPAVATGALAAVVVIGPGPGDRIVVRVASTLAFSLVAFVLITLPSLPSLLSRPPLAGGDPTWPMRVTRLRVALAPVAGVVAAVAGLVAAADRRLADGRIDADLVAVVAVGAGAVAVVGGALGRRVTARRVETGVRPSSVPLPLPVPLAAVAAAGVLAAQSGAGLGSAAALLAIGGVIAALAVRRIGLVALGPGLAATATGVGVAFATVEVTGSPVLVAAVLVACALLATAASTAEPDGRPSGPAWSGLGSVPRSVRRVAQVGAVGFAVIPVWGAVGADLGDYQTAAAVGAAAIAAVIAGGSVGFRAAPRIAPVGTGSLWRRPRPATPDHGNPLQPAEVEATVEADLQVDGDEALPHPQSAVAASSRVVPRRPAGDVGAGRVELRTRPGRTAE